MSGKKKKNQTPLFWTKDQTMPNTIVSVDSKFWNLSREEKKYILSGLSIWIAGEIKEL